VAEDHHPEGGLGEAVIDALVEAEHSNLSVTHLARARDARFRLRQATPRMGGHRC
jgi:hypothetical protein